MEALRNAIQTRGDLAKVSEWSGVNQTTISRIARGVTRNPGIETIHRIEAACQRLASERSEATKSKSSEKADEANTKSRKPSAAVAKAGA